MDASEKRESERELQRKSFPWKFVTAYLQEQLEYALETLFLELLAARLATPPCVCERLCVFVVSLKVCGVHRKTLLKISQSFSLNK